MSKKTKITFGDRLYYLRKRVIKLNQTEFRKSLGTAHCTISHYETEERKPGLEFLQKIKSEYKVNLNWLISGEGEMVEELIKE